MYVLHRISLSTARAETHVLELASWNHIGLYAALGVLCKIIRTLELQEAWQDAALGQQVSTMNLAPERGKYCSYKANHRRACKETQTFKR